MRELVLIAMLGAASVLAVACSSETFSGSDGGGAGGGSNTGGSNTDGSPSVGGASGSAGSLQAGGARSTGGARATGGASGTGASPAAGGSPSRGGSPATGGFPNDSGTSRDSGGMSSDAGTVRCTGANPSFPAFEKSCSTVADCSLVRHMTSCCGSQLYMAINHEDLARFQTAEGVCDAQYPACGCASQGPEAEDGTRVPWGSENLFVASCDNEICRSHYAGKTFACGPKTCTDQQLCNEFSGGPAGSPTSYDCNPLSTCKSCACMDPNTSAGCRCSESQGFMTISCAAP
jgi:hypothetical protein